MNTRLLDEINFIIILDVRKIFIVLISILNSTVLEIILEIL